MSERGHVPSHNVVYCGSEQKENSSISRIRIPIVRADYMVIYICMICLAAILLCLPHEACSIFCLHSYKVASYSRASFDNFRRRLIFKPLEIVYEELAKLRHFFFEVRLPMPGFGRV